MFRSAMLRMLAVTCLAWMLWPLVARPAESADRQRILSSPPWKQALHDLDEWYSVQKVYTADELGNVKRQFDQKVARMSADELAGFLQDLQQKLVILNGEEARDARKWFGETLAVAAPEYAKKIQRRRRTSQA